jgi:hypothetical protein
MPSPAFDDKSENFLITICVILSQRTNLLQHFEGLPFDTTLSPLTYQVHVPNLLGLMHGLSPANNGLNPES